jgi:hypothetical protein
VGPDLWGSSAGCGVTTTSWLVAGLAVAGLWLAGNHYPSGWALFAGAQVLSLPATLTGQPYALAPLLAAGGLVGLHHWRRARRPLVRVRWPGRARRGVARARW